MSLNNNKTPQELVFLIPSLEAGGAEGVTVELANGFAQRGYKVSLVLFEAKGDFFVRLCSLVEIVDIKAKKVISLIIKLIRFLLKNKPNILLSTIVISDIFAVLLKIILSNFTYKPKVAVRVGTTISKLPRSKLKKLLERLLVRFIYPRADVIIANSHGVADDLVQYACVKKENLHVIYNPVITQAFLHQMEEEVSHPWFQKNVDLPIIISVGRLSKEKDFSTLIRSFSRMKKISTHEIVQRACLVILGEGIERPSLQALAQELGIAEFVSMPGFVPNPAAYLFKSKVFVLSSQFEGLPNVLIQAMACGCRLISTDCPHGPKEILKQGEYGTLIPVGDVESMAHALVKALLDESTIKPPPSWLRQFELDFVIDQYEQVLFG